MTILAQFSNVILLSIFGKQRHELYDDVFCQTFLHDNETFTPTEQLHLETMK